jgi:hypothetical protein
MTNIKKKEKEKEKETFFLAFYRLVLTKNMRKRIHTSRENR